MSTIQRISVKMHIGKLLVTLLFLILPFCTQSNSQNVLTPGKAENNLLEIQDFGLNPGNLQMFLYEPKNLPRKRISLVVALHGCYGSARQFSSAGFNELADKFSFLVLYPQQRKENQEIACFHTMMEDHEAQQIAEAKSVMHMIRYMRQRNRIRSTGIYLTGFSSGGQFANYLALRYPETFSAVGLMGSGGYKCRKGHQGIYGVLKCTNKSLEYSLTLQGKSGKRRKWPRVSIWHGQSDKNIDVSRALEAKNFWMKVHGIKKLMTLRNSGAMSVQAYRGEKSKPLLESRLFPDMAHEIPVIAGQCGQPGGYFINSSVCYAREMVKFFGIKE